VASRGDGSPAPEARETAVGDGLAPSRVGHRQCRWTAWLGRRRSRRTANGEGASFGRDWPGYGALRAVAHRRL